MKKIDYYPPNNNIFNIISEKNKKPQVMIKYVTIFSKLSIIKSLL